MGERFGPALAAEHLNSEDGLKIDAETLRRWMLAEGRFARAAARAEDYHRRAPREHRDRWKRVSLVNAVSPVMHFQMTKRAYEQMLALVAGSDLRVRPSQTSDQDRWLLYRRGVVEGDESRFT